MFFWLKQTYQIFPHVLLETFLIFSSMLLKEAEVLMATSLLPSVGQPPHKAAFWDDFRGIQLHIPL